MVVSNHENFSISYGVRILRCCPGFISNRELSDVSPVPQRKFNRMPPVLYVGGDSAIRPRLRVQIHEEDRSTGLSLVPYWGIQKYAPDGLSND